MISLLRSTGGFGRAAVIHKIAQHFRLAHAPRAADPHHWAQVITSYFPKKRNVRNTSRLCAFRHFADVIFFTTSEHIPMEGAPVSPLRPAQMIALDSCTQSDTQILTSKSRGARGCNATSCLAYVSPYHAFQHHKVEPRRLPAGSMSPDHLTRSPRAPVHAHAKTRLHIPNVNSYLAPATAETTSTAPSQCPSKQSNAEPTVN